MSKQHFQLLKASPCRLPLRSERRRRLVCRAGINLVPGTRLSWGARLPVVYTGQPSNLPMGAFVGAKDFATSNKSYSIVASCHFVSYILLKSAKMSSNTKIIKSL
jgi:hypothetical protein